MKVLAQFDGSNFYNRVKKLSPKTHLTNYKYNDLAKYITGATPDMIYYVGEIRKYPGNEKSEKLYASQQSLFTNLRKRKVEIKLGYLLQNKGVFTEKGVDVQIAVDIVRSSLKDEYDKFYLISSDTDLLPAIKTAQQEGKQIIYVGFENFVSRALYKNCSDSQILTKEEVEKFSYTKFDKKIIFVHGYTASSQADWYPKIKPMLDKFEVDYSIPDLPGGKHPKSKDWIDIVKREIKTTLKPVVLVGHSLGTRAILLYLDKYQKKADMVILIAPLSNEVKNAQRRGGQTYPDFFEYKIDMEKIKKLAKKFVVMHSKDDSSLDYYEHGVPLSKELGTEIITYEDRDHFSAPENAPYVFEILRDKLAF